MMPPAADPVPGRVVLIVDDTEPCGAMLEIALSAIPGLVFCHAPHGAEAWRLLEEDAAGPVCALVTDLHMPVLDGFALIARVRASPRHRKLPILVLSGATETGTGERLRQLGADAYFEKPYSPHRVRATLEKLLYERDAL